MSSDQTINSVHKLWLDLLLKSPSLCRSLGSSGLFVFSLLKRLSLLSSNAIVLCSFLRIIQLLHLCHPSPRQFVLDNDLYSVVKKFTVSDNQVLVFQVAKRLLIEIQLSTMT